MTIDIALWKQRPKPAEAFIHTWWVKRDATVGKLFSFLNEMEHCAVDLLCKPPAP